MTTQNAPMAPQVVFSGDLVAAHINGQQCAARFVRVLAGSCPHGGELSQLLAIDSMDVAPERRAYLNGLLRELQKSMERSHG